VSPLAIDAGNKALDLLNAAGACRRDAAIDA
jgi:hypothetical protein